MFSFSGKVALITGAGNGVGFAIAREFLKNGIKGVTIAEINREWGKEAVKKLEMEFGQNKVIFVQTDVADNASFEEAFKQTVQYFKNLDILVNNAGILQEINFERTLQINLVFIPKKAVIFGTYLAAEQYFPNYKSTNEGVIVNIASITGLSPTIMSPTYTATKSGVISFSQAYGSERISQFTKCRILILCPSATKTHILDTITPQSFRAPYYMEIYDKLIQQMVPQKSESVGVAVVDIVKKAKTGTVWITEDNKEVYEAPDAPKLME